jgi:hypothetical protein
LCGSADYFDKKINLYNEFLLKRLTDGDLKDIISIIIHEKTHLESFEKSKTYKKLWYGEEVDLEIDEECDVPPEFSFKHTRKFLRDSVEFYSYDYEFGVFTQIVNLHNLTRKQFDHLSLCVLKDFLEDPEFKKRIF